MSGITNAQFTDPSVMPDDEIIASIIGRKIDLWNSVLRHAEENYNEVSGSWNYYKDGKQWLFKFVQKKKTLFWAAVFEKTFRITFYFGDKAESLVLDSDLPEAMKDGFRNAKRFGSIRPVSVLLAEQKDVDNVIKLISLKIK